MRRDRRGAVLAAAIVCLLVAMLVGAALARSLALQHRQTHSEFQRLQAMWLAEAGVSRAWRAVRNNQSYTGEQWKTSVEPFGGRIEAVVNIRVETVSNQPRQRKIDVEARLPADSLSGTAFRKHLEVTLPEGGSSP